MDTTPMICARTLTGGASFLLPIINSFVEAHFLHPIQLASALHRLSKRTIPILPYPLDWRYGYSPFIHVILAVLAQDRDKPTYCRTGCFESIISLAVYADHSIFFDPINLLPPPNNNGKVSGRKPLGCFNGVNHRLQLPVHPAKDSQELAPYSRVIKINLPY